MLVPLVLTCRPPAAQYMPLAFRIHHCQVQALQVMQCMDPTASPSLGPVLPVRKRLHDEWGHPAAVDPGHALVPLLVLRTCHYCCRAPALSAIHICVAVL
eukprot:4558984-Pyramimonas_sp.AAC.1